MARPSAGSKKKEPAKSVSRELKSWSGIARYLHKPVTTVKRWADEGMPVRRKGRFVIADAEELQKWLGEGDAVQGAVHVAEPGEDLTAELRKGLAAVKKSRR